MKTDPLERLRAANPVATVPNAGPAPVFAETEQAKAHSWRAFVRSRRLGVLAFGVVLLGIAAAVATAYAPSPWDSHGEHGPPVDTSTAERVVEFTLTSGHSVWSGGTRIALWRLPQVDPWVCYRIALASPAPTPNNGGNPLGEGTCLRGTPEVPRGEPMTLGVSTAPAEDWLVTGQVNPASGIAAIELDSASGRLPLSYANGWFITQIPRRGWSGERLPPEGGPYVLVGRDDAGNVVARVDVERARASIEEPAKRSR